MALTLAELVAEHKAALNDAASVFVAADDGDFKRHLQHAARRVAQEKRPRTKLGTLTLVAEQAKYSDVPADLLQVKVGLWPAKHVVPWDLPIGPLPTLSLALEADNTRALMLTPAPTAAHLAVLGSAYSFYYCAAHELTDSVCTIQEADRNLLLLAAQVEALRELAFRGYTKPVSLRQGAPNVGGPTRNSTPAALYQALLVEFREAA